MAPTMILEKRWVNRLAVMEGKVSNEITITMPTILRQEMMVSAMNIINKYSKRTTGSFCERAYSLSYAIKRMVLKKHPKKIINNSERMPNIHMSVEVMVRIFPNRYVERSGVNPGAKKLKIIPTAIPNVQNTAIAESSRISFRLLSHSTPNADSVAKTAADRRGEIPVYRPIPIPPNDA